MGVFWVLSTTFAVVVGTAGAVVGLFAWRLFRHTAFERSVVALFVLFASLTAYHALLLVAPGSLEADVFEAVMYTALAGFVLQMVYFQLRVDDRFEVLFRR